MKTNLNNILLSDINNTAPAQESNNTDNKTLKINLYDLIEIFRLIIGLKIKYQRRSKYNFQIFI